MQKLIVTVLIAAYALFAADEPKPQPQPTVQAQLDAAREEITQLRKVIGDIQQRDQRIMNEISQKLINATLMSCEKDPPPAIPAPVQPKTEAAKETPK